jgi:hypothetical protein
LQEAGVRLASEADGQLAEGFASDDAFDAFVGLASLVLVVEGRRPAACPDDPVTQQVEGWILGQAGSDENGAVEPAAARGPQAPELEAAERALLERIHVHEAALRALLDECGGHWSYEDPVYRFYHQSFKVFGLQRLTTQIVSALADLAPAFSLHPWFAEIVRAGTGKVFSLADNSRWTETTRPILEAFFHARFFLEMAVRYSHLQAPPRPLPSGYAALLYLYGLR